MANSSVPEKTSTNTKTDAFLRFFRAVVIVAVIGWLASTVYSNTINDNSDNPFKLGLDLAGGSHLIYEADVTGIDPLEVPDLMNTLRDVIEKRINIFGVSEPAIYVETSSFVTEEQHQRLVVELPGVTDVSEAVAEIGRTPLLEFKLLDPEALAAQNAVASIGKEIEDEDGAKAVVSNVRTSSTAETLGVGEPYIDTGLTGRYLESARLEFAGSQSGQVANEPIVSLRFTSEGGKLFADITRSHVGEQLAIFLDGEMISSPRINEAITGGTAIISGNFDPAEARALAQNLNFGALPVPIELISTQTIGATLGQEVLDKGVKAGAVGFGLILLFMILWYRLSGLVAGIALMGYVIIMLALFQYIPVTLTAAGLAGFIISLGMAVDANVLVFERMKEELRAGKNSREAAVEGFNRAWGAIRDGNVTSILSAIILFWFGSSLVKGFALVFGIGVVVSMLSALVVTRTLLMALPDVKQGENKIWSFLFGCGLSK
ncbi:MAG: protein translocase subunit SecD [Candidatus Nomurabacteria bacterium]|nr:protein translocase subunit SecD [Candidatus Nomurabacteria bacterium]USN88165.1 MAG: protein translocase subunit SecD [Candidatus Nomurabacteria bacterium]